MHGSKKVCRCAFAEGTLDLGFKEPGGVLARSLKQGPGVGYFSETQFLSVSMGMFLSPLTSSSEGCCQGILTIYRQQHPEKYRRYRVVVLLCRSREKAREIMWTVSLKCLKRKR